MGYRLSYLTHAGPLKRRRLNRKSRFRPGANAISPEIHSPAQRVAVVPSEGRDREILTAELHKLLEEIKLRRPEVAENNT